MNDLINRLEFDNDSTVVKNGNKMLILKTLKGDFTQLKK